LTGPRLLNAIVWIRRTEFGECSGAERVSVKRVMGPKADEMLPPLPRDEGQGDSITHRVVSVVAKNDEMAESRREFQTMR